ncbi:hypothetical protein [Streptomyces hawaiiensis]|uniref:hypothetical protein n=1 Tax=Streptomyces hawaiiensis TaxID=67305 RepID=UPI00365884B3
MKRITGRTRSARRARADGIRRAAEHPRRYRVAPFAAVTGEAVVLVVDEGDMVGRSDVPGA